MRADDCRYSTNPKLIHNIKPARRIPSEASRAFAKDRLIRCRFDAFSHGRSPHALGMAASCAGARQHSATCCLPSQRSKTNSLATRLECVWSASRMLTSSLRHVFQPLTPTTALKRDRNHSSYSFALCLLRVCIAWLNCSSLVARSANTDMEVLCTIQGDFACASQPGVKHSDMTHSVQ